MDWYLPEGNPLLWDEMRRRLRGVEWYRLLFLNVAVLGGLLALYMLQAPVNTDPLRWTALSRICWGIILVCQMLLVILVAPSLTASAFTSEQERGTLESLLLSPLLAKELVIGKFLSAMLVIGFFLLAGIPVAALVLLMGGVSPLELIVAYLSLLSAGAFYAALGLFASCNSRKTTQAFAKAYLYTVVALLGSCCCMVSIMGAGSIMMSGLFSLFMLPLATYCLLEICKNELELKRKPQQQTTANDWADNVLPAGGYKPLPEINDFGIVVRTGGRTKND